MTSTNQLYYGDNLEVLRLHIADESVDLIYLDPPFNSNAAYNVLFKTHSGDAASAQIEAFDDTWHWGPLAEQEYADLTRGQTTIEVAKFIESMHNVLGNSDMMAYLVMMAPRLVEMRRSLKPSGSLYLHCDPTASHYLKLLLDSIFGPTSFVNEIIWQRTSSHNRTVRYGPVHDVILFYAKSADWYWQEQHVPYDQKYIDDFYGHIEDDTGRKYQLDNLTSNRPGGRYLWNGKPPPGSRFWGYSEETMKRFEAEGRLIYSKNGNPRYKRYLDEMPGQLLQDIWTDIPPISSQSSERLGYPTQKPIALLERIIKASCPPDGTVLDPFCGCGTATDAAQQLGRSWVGIDITYIAIDLIIKRLQHRYGDNVRSSFTVNGIPKDIESADALFERNPFDFERWAVSMVNGQPNDKQVGDRGVDGRIRYDDGTEAAGIAIVSVKGGQQLNPAMVRDLAGTMSHENSTMGILVTRNTPTRGMLEAARKSGTYQLPKTLNKFPKIQIVTVSELLDGKRPDMPPVYLPYIRAKRKPDAEAVPLF